MKKIHIPVLGITVGVLCLSAVGRTTEWTGNAGDGKWSTAGNWSNDTPRAEDNVYFRNGGTYDVDLTGVDITLNLLSVGYGDTEKRATRVTFVGGKVTTTGKSMVSSFDNNPGSAFIVKGGEMTIGACQATSNSTVAVTDGGTLSAASIDMEDHCTLIIDRATLHARTRLNFGDSKYITFKMNAGSVFKTRGEEIDLGTVDTAIVDVTGGRYIVGSESKGFQSAVNLPDTYGFMDKLDEFTVEFPNGGNPPVGTQTVLRPAFGYNRGSGNHCLSLTNESVLRVSGGTPEAPVPCMTLYKTFWYARSIEIAPNACARLSWYDSDSMYVARNISIGANAVVTLSGSPLDRGFLKAYGSSYVDPSARIKVNFTGATGLESGKTYPIFIGAPGASDLSPDQFELVSVPDGWSVVCVGPCAYLTDGQLADATGNARWTGKGSDNNFTTLANWTTDTERYKNPYMTGEKNTIVNYDYTGALTKRIGFDACSAPFILTNGTVKVNSSQTSTGTSSSTYNNSRYPAIFKSAFQPGNSSDAASGSVDAYGAYIAFMNELCPSERAMYFRGDVLVGGEAKVKTMTFNGTTALRVLSGGSLAVSGQVTANNGSGTIVVEGGGTMTFAAGDGAAFAYSTAECRHVVDGLLDIKAPFGGSTDIGFIGTGVVQVARIVAPDAGTSAVKLSGGVTFRPAAWETDAITLAVPAGEEGVLLVDADATGDLGGLISVGRDAKLVKTGAGSLRFAAPATVDGTVDVQSGLIEVTGDLKEAAASGYVNVLTAADITGTIQVSETYRVRIVDAANGAKTLCMKEKHGMLLLFR